MLLGALLNLCSLIFGRNLRHRLVLCVEEFLAVRGGGGGGGGGGGFFRD
jgi:hypothetical protein